MTDCKHLVQQIIKTLEQNADFVSTTVTDGVLKLDYTSVIFVDLGVKVDGTYYCDLLMPDINISHGSAATPLRYGGICNDLFIVNSMKEF